MFNETDDNQEIFNYFESLGSLPDMNLHKDMVAKYLECGESQNMNSPSIHGCLQKLSCILHDQNIYITRTERNVATM